MLTLDLLRSKIVGDEIRPVYLSPSSGSKYVKVAGQILDTYRAHVGRTVGELDDAVAGLTGGAADYKVHRGLAKVLDGFREVVPPSDVDAEELRMRVFTAAAAYRPIVRRSDLVFLVTADDALAAIADEFQTTPDEISKGFYSDLKENQVLASVEPSLDALRLVHRYNTALAQAMLYRAIQMRIEVYDNFRQVFQYIKLTRLMHTIQPMGTGYVITLDGPLSLNAHTERYGIGMAKLLPALLSTKKWRMEAVVNTTHAGHRLFKLHDGCGLLSHYPEQPQFDSTAEEAFFDKFSRNTKTKWTIEREGSLLDLRDTVMIPDFVFRHPDGRVVHLEIVGYWRPEYLEKKLDKIRRAGDVRLVLAVPEALNCSLDDFDGPVIRYKMRLLMKDVLPVLESVGSGEGEKQGSSSSGGFIIRPELAAEGSVIPDV